VEIYLGVTALYVLSALIANRVMALVEHTVRVPGYVGGGK
jgi:glutamate/aspartate transport system permease protein